MTSKQLRSSILQAAIQGQLVPQEPSDTPAALLQERKIRRDKNASVIYRTDEGSYYERILASGEETCIDDEIPFDIPDSWQWTRLSSIGRTETGATPPKSNPEYFGDYIPFLSPANISDNKIVGEIQGLSEIGMDYGRVIPAGSILQVCIGGSIGKCAIANQEVTFNQQINSITPIKSSVEYIYYVLQSNAFYTQIKEKETGTATPIINRGNWEQLLIPIPPLEEQERIVARIEELMTLVDQYDQAKVALDELESTLPDMLQQSILQAAIQGQLVPQESSDTPAALLLERIQAERERLIEEKKIRRDKNASVIYRTDEGSYYERNLTSGEETCIDDEIPFDIPDSWQWTRLRDVAKDITDFVASGSFASIRENVKYYSHKEYAILVRTKDLSNHFKGDLVYTDKHGYEFLSNSNLFGGELILPNIGGSIGKVFIIPYIDRPMTLAPNSIMIRGFDDKTKNWLYNLFLSPFGQSLLVGISSATAQNKFNKTILRNVLFPIPPLEEQKRIVARIEELMRYTDRLKSFTNPD